MQTERESATSTYRLTVYSEVATEDARRLLKESVQFFDSMWCVITVGQTSRGTNFIYVDEGHFFLMDGSFNAFGPACEALPAGVEIVDGWEQWKDSECTVVARFDGLEISAGSDDEGCPLVMVTFMEHDLSVVIRDPHFPSLALIDEADLEKLIQELDASISADQTARSASTRMDSSTGAIGIKKLTCAQGA